MSTTTESGADKVSREIFDQLCFMSEDYSATTAEGYKEFIVYLFSNLQEVVNDESIPEALTGRYSALVYLIMHHFLDMRHQIASGIAVSPHVLPALDALAGVDTAKDVKLIFRLLEVSMRTANTISFADGSADEMDLPNEGYDDDHTGGTATSTGNEIDLLTTDTVQKYKGKHPLTDDFYNANNDIDMDKSVHLDSIDRNTADCDVHGILGGNERCEGEGEEEGEGNSLHGSDVMHTDLGVFHSNIFDECDFDLDSPIPVSPVPVSYPLIPTGDELKTANNVVTYNTINDDTNTNLNPTRIQCDSTLDETKTEGNDSNDNGKSADYVGIQFDLKDFKIETDSDISLSPIAAVAVSPTPIAVSPVVTVGASETPKNKAFADWEKVRRGITLERIDSERARLVRTAEALQLAAEATDKFWVKLVRKVESESFNDAHDCQWKLGVSHESFFPGRKRVVLRPRFDVSMTDEYLGDDAELREREREYEADRRHAQKLKEDAEGRDDGFDIPFKDLGEVKAALAKAWGGLITDITQSTLSDLAAAIAPIGDEDARHLDNKISPRHDLHRKSGFNTPEPGTLVPPGCGWGLVDADGSDEGYGVIGLEMGLDSDHDGSHHRLVAGTGGGGGGGGETLVGDGNGNGKSEISVNGLDKASASLTSGPNSIGVKPIASNVSGGTGAVMNDRMGDVRLVEATMREGRDAVETGPCHSGTKKAGSGPTILISRVIMVTASGNFWGTLSFNGKEVFFTSSFEPEDGHKDDSAAVNLVQQLRMRRRRWTLSSVCAIYLRRYRLRDSAIEIFFRRGKHRNFFVDFGHTREDERHRQAFARALMDVAPAGCFKQWPSMSQYRLVSELGVQEKWLSGRMSNFDYLMALNTISGRSFNDLCQYPVMPWILSQYTDDTIDLNDPASYRDLSKPVGALNETRLKDFLERYHSFGEQTTSVGASNGNSSGQCKVSLYCLCFFVCV